MAYVLEFVDELQPEDQVFEDHGVKVFIDPKSMVYLDGTELDAEEIVRRSLKIAADICIYTNDNITIETLEI